VSKTDRALTGELLEAGFKILASTDARDAKIS
jgi:hypothetical protein